jgi:signal peptidase I
MRFRPWRISRSNKRSAFRDWMKALLWALAILWVFKTFLFNWTVIDSTSMRDALKPGDLLIVNKLSVGGRFPVSPIAVPFTNFYVNASIPVFRFPGFSDVETNDIVIFNDPTEITIPIDRRTQLSKRCVGTPGDTVQLIDRVVFVNGVELEETPGIVENYWMDFTDSTEVPELLESLGVTEGSKLSDDGDWLISTTVNIVTVLKEQGHVVRLWDDDQSEMNGVLFPWDNYGWDQYNYGPLIVPAEDKSIGLRIGNIALYQPIIEASGHIVTTSGGAVLIDGIVVTEYTFEQDHFFVLGDNRSNAADSRFWGFLPEDHLIGTAFFVLW